MLREWLQHLMTPCPPYLRRLGYLKQLIGMQARHRRCREAWAPHLQHTRDMILAAADACSSHDKVVILGSGLLLDVPVEELSERFKTVELVDILHMPQVRHAVSGLANVRLLTRDITGVVEPLSRGDIPQPDIADLGVNGASLVVSCNILSQLGILPEQLSPGISDRLVAAHLDALAGLGGTVCLITETSHRLMEGETEVEKSAPLDGNDIPDSLKMRRQCWDWDFAPAPERHPRYDLIHTVEGFIRSGNAET